MLEAGTSFDEMIGYYREHYNIETTRSLWSRAYARLIGKGKRPTPNPKFLPWRECEREGVRNRAGNKYREMLFILGRIDRKEDVPPDQLEFVLDVEQDLIMDNQVITYDRERCQYVTVPRRDGIDKGWIRDPFLDDRGRPFLVPDEEVRPEAIRVWFPINPRDLLTPGPLYDGSGNKES